MTKTELKEALLELPPEERFEVVEAGWESLEVDRERLPITEEQRMLLEERLAAYRADPDAAISWDEVRARVTARL